MIYYDKVPKHSNLYSKQFCSTKINKVLELARNLPTFLELTHRRKILCEYNYVSF